MMVKHECINVWYARGTTATSCMNGPAGVTRTPGMDRGWNGAAWAGGLQLVPGIPSGGQLSVTYYYIPGMILHGR